MVRKLVRYLIVVLLSILFSLYCFEYYLVNNVGYLNIHKKSKILKEQTGLNYDKRSKIQAYKDLKKKYSDLTVTIVPKTYAVNYPDKNIMPLSGVSNTKTLHCNENGYYSIFDSDRYGFNNPDKDWDAEEIEYLLVGDSSTHGSCVNRPNDIGSVLRTLSNKSVLNLGYRGNGPLTEYATLREYLTPKVKKVVWIYTATDFLDLTGELEDDILMNYLKDKNYSQNLISKQKLVDNLAIELIERDSKKEQEKAYPLLEFIKLYKIRTKLLTKERTALTNEFKDVLKAAKDLTKANNSEFYLVYLPVYTRYTNKYDYSTYEKIQEIVNELQIPFIDLHKEIFEKEDNPMSLFPLNNGHYNKDGYRKSGETIYKLTKN